MTSPDMAGFHAAILAAGGPDEIRATGRHRSSSAPRTHERHVFQDVVFLVAGCAGMLAVAWLVFSAITGATIILFMTGSMSPSIPAGGASLSMPASAADLRVGDIVTAQIDDAGLPVTHRIVSIAQTGDSNTRALVLQGDDNATSDLFPYVVDEVPRVVIGGAGWGTALTIARSPIVIGTMTFAIAALCGWAFWPTRRADAAYPLHESD